MTSVSQMSRSKTFFQLLMLIATGFLLRAQAQVPQSNHVFVLMEENHSYEQVIGSTAMPYLNSLANANAVAANYDADSHYSIPNYFWMTAGAFVTLNDRTTAKFDVDNVTRYLAAAGKSWKAYEDGLPFAGYVGPSQNQYEENHDPFSYFTDVANSSEKMNIVPISQLATDIASGTLPNYSFITPDGVDDAHNASLSAADKWLKANIAPLLATPIFQPGGDGILFITFDESLDTDCRPLTTCPHLPENGGGGRVATLIIGPMVKQGYQSSVFYQHPSVLKTMLLALGVSGAPGAAQSATPMADVFGASATNALGVSPGSLTFSAQNIGTTSAPQAVQVTNGGSAAVAVNSISTSGDFAESNNCGTQLAASSSCTVNVTFTPTVSGTRTGTLALTDSANNSPQTVALGGTGASTSGCIPNNANPSVTICTPTSGQIVASPVHIVAVTTDSNPVKLMQIYLDGVKQYQVYASTLDTSLAMSSGTHRLVVLASDGTIFKQTIYITVQ